MQTHMHNTEAHTICVGALACTRAVGASCPSAHLYAFLDPTGVCGFVPWSSCVVVLQLSSRGAACKGSGTAAAMQLCRHSSQGECGVIG
jgi:hypothetical protein